MLRKEAREIAVQAHGDAEYGTGVPYSDHLDEVVAVLKEYGHEGDHALAGYLHDVVEDTPKSAEDLLAAGVPDEVVAIVLFVTDETGHNRKERKAKTYRRVRSQLDEHRLAPKGCAAWVHKALRVKLADRLANVRACLRSKSGLLGMYRKERRAFREAYYLPGVCGPMWVEYDRLLGG